LKAAAEDVIQQSEIDNQQSTIGNQINQPVDSV